MTVMKMTIMNVKTKRFLSFLTFAAKCLAICAGVLFLLFLSNRRYERVMDNPYHDADKFHYLDSGCNDIQICNIGSSHGEYAFSYENLSKKAGYECFNFAMASQTYNYDYAILSMYREHFAGDCILFIPVSYFSFNNEVVNDAEAQFLDVKYYSFLSPRYIPHYSPYVDIVAHRLPILSAGEDIVKIFPALSLRAFAAGTSLPENDAAFLVQFRQKACARYNRHMRDKEEYFLSERVRNLCDILDFCRENGITPVLITTPFTAYYFKQAPTEFKDDFHRVVTSVADRYGVSYYDYSEDGRFAQHLEYFSDSDHLNETGAALFMDIIGKEIPEFADFLSRTPPARTPSPG